MGKNAESRCVEMVLKSIEARRIAVAGEKRERPPAQYYTSEFYYLTAARFYALAAGTLRSLPAGSNVRSIQ